MADSNQTSRAVLVVHGDPALKEELALQLGARGYDVLEATDAETGTQLLLDASPLMVFLDAAMERDPAVQFLTAASTQSPDTPIVVVSKDAEAPQSIGHLEVDAFEWIARPLSVPALEHALRHVSFHLRLQDAAQAHLRYLERRNVQLDVRLHELEKMGTELQHEQRAAASDPDGAVAASDEDSRKARVVEAAFDSAVDAIVITDAGGQIIYANRAFEGRFGSSALEASHDLSRLFVNPSVAVSMRENVESLGNFSCEVPMIAQGGKEFPALARATAITDPQTGERSRLYIFSDITEQEQLRQQAYHDALTGLYSRRHFTELLLQNMSMAKRHGHALSLCLADLDNFKGVNDTYGHNVGDEVLRTFSRIVSEEIRAEDVAGRLGGDEFCIVFPYVSADVAAICLERIRQKFAATTFSTDDGTTFTTSATFGIVDMAPPDIRAEAFINLADQCLYQAKEHGRNCTVANRAVVE